MDTNTDIEPIFTMDDAADMQPSSSDCAAFLSAPAEPARTTLLPSPSFEMDRGRTRSRSITRRPQPRNPRTDNSMCRGRTRRRSISPAPSICTCPALAIPLRAPCSPSLSLSPTRVFLHQLSFGNNRQRDAAPCRDPECNKKRAGSRHRSSVRVRPFSAAPPMSRSRSRNRASIASTDSPQQPMSAKSFASMSRLRYQVLLESGHSDEEHDHNDNTNNSNNSNNNHNNRSLVGLPNHPTTYDLGGKDGQLLWSFYKDSSST